LPEKFPDVEAVEHFAEADSPQAAMDKLVAFLQDLEFRGEVAVRNYSDTNVYFTAEIGSDESRTSVLLRRLLTEAGIASAAR
jgi:hypothetical protein